MIEVLGFLAALGLLALGFFRLTTGRWVREPSEYVDVFVRDIPDVLLDVEGRWAERSGDLGMVVVLKLRCLQCQYIYYARLVRNPRANAPSLRGCPSCTAEAVEE